MRKLAFLHSLLGVLCELEINSLYEYHARPSVRDVVSVNNPSFSEFIKFRVGVLRRKLSSKHEFRENLTVNYKFSLAVTVLL